MRIPKIHLRMKHRNSLVRDVRGQALVETALSMAILTAMVAMAANFAYLTYLNSTTSSAARQAAIFAIQGQYGNTGTALPVPASACAAASNEVNGWLSLPESDWGAMVASAPAGSSSWGQTASCTGGTAASAPFAPDPESATFGVAAVATSANYNMPIQFSFLGFHSLAPDSYQVSHTLYVRQLN